MEASFSHGEHTRNSRYRVPLMPLLTSDSAVKQILLTMNEKEPFIIEDLDDYHLVIKADDEYRVRKDLEAEVSKPGILPRFILTLPFSWRRTLTAWKIIDVRH